MALKVQASFAGGELAPELQERTTLGKFKDGLATARNVIVSKTGNIITRIARSNFATCKLNNRKVAIYSPPASKILLEWGHQYVRLYTFGGVLLDDRVHAFLESDLPSIQFEASQGYVFVFCAGKEIYKYFYLAPGFAVNTDVFGIPVAPVSATLVAAGTPAGYQVDYMATYLNAGEESFGFTYNDAGSLLPIAVGQQNTLNFNLLLNVNAANVTEMRVYRRPAGGGAFGYIGSSSVFQTSGADFHGIFIDFGGGADYTHGPPVPITPGKEDPRLLHSPTGGIYQQRLIIVDNNNLEVMYASRPGFQNDFLQSYPIAADSALKFKCGSSGYAKVLRMIDSNGLWVFTSVGGFLSQGSLDPTNLTMAKVTKCVIDPGMGPIAIPGGLLIVDVTSNTIRNMIYSYQIQGYVPQEVSVFSNHLFLTRKIVSWAFHEGAFPLLWVVFDDGSYASFTYELDQEMRAWTRHDSAWPVEGVAATAIAETTFFIVNKNGQRYIEVTNPRHVPAAAFVTDSDADKNPTCAFMDSIVSTKNLLNNSLTNGDVFTIDLNPGGDWGGPLVLRCGTSNVFAAPFPPIVPQPGYIGSIFRTFDSDKTAYDLTVIAWHSPNEVVVQPNIPFNPALAPSSFNLYFTFNTVGGLNHMEGENVSVIVDGAVVCSPNNDEQNYPIATVVGGTITLPNGLYGAIVHVGRPITADIETLEIATVEQGPVLLESLNIGKMYVKVNNSNGLYVSNRFPVDQNVKGMELLDNYTMDYTQDNPIIGNKYQAPYLKRFEVTMPGDWKRMGKIAMRNVDPLHNEILSIIPDVEILQRGR